MRLPHRTINKAYDLHYSLVESYKALNQHLLQAELPDEARIAYYTEYFTKCQSIKSCVADTINALHELQTQSCCSFFSRSDNAVKDFLMIVYDERNFQEQEQIRQQRDSFIKSIPSPACFYHNLALALHFYDNSILPINTLSKRFTALFQKSIEKMRDFCLEQTIQSKIAEIKSHNTLKKDEKDTAISAIIANVKFRHPFFIHKYRNGYSTLETTLSVSPTS